MSGGFEGNRPAGLVPFFKRKTRWIPCKKKKKICDVIVHGRATVSTEILPSQPEDVQVEVNSSTRVLVTWNKPSANSATVKEYVVNATMLKSFDGARTVLDNDGGGGGNSQSVVTPHSIQVKVLGKTLY